MAKRIKQMLVLLLCSGEFNGVEKTAGDEVQINETMFPQLKKAGLVSEIAKGKKTADDKKVEITKVVKTPKIETDLKEKTIVPKVETDLTKNLSELTEELREEYLQNLVELEGVDESLANKLIDEGFYSMKSISETEVEKLVVIKGIGEKLAPKIIDSAKEFLG